MRDRHVVTVAGKSVYEGETIYSAKGPKVIFTYWNSIGGLGTGEAMIAGTFVFGLMLMFYGVVPDRWLRLADGELKWRSDKFGIPVGGIAIGGHHLFKKPYLLFPKGLPLLHGHFVITAK